MFYSEINTQSEKDTQRNSERKRERGRESGSGREKELQLLSVWNGQNLWPGQVAFCSISCCCWPQTWRRLAHTRKHTHSDLNRNVCIYANEVAKWKPQPKLNRTVDSFVAAKRYQKSVPSAGASSVARPILSCCCCCCQVQWPGGRKCQVTRFTQESHKLAECQLWSFYS